MYRIPRLSPSGPKIDMPSNGILKVPTFYDLDLVPVKSLLLSTSRVAMSFIDCHYRSMRHDTLTEFGA